MAFFPITQVFFARFFFLKLKYCSNIWLQLATWCQQSLKYQWYQMPRTCQCDLPYRLRGWCLHQVNKGKALRPISPWTFSFSLQYCLSQLISFELQNLVA
jgi:hypothetical protein